MTTVRTRRPAARSRVAAAGPPTDDLVVVRDPAPVVDAPVEVVDIADVTGAPPGDRLRRLQQRRRLLREQILALMFLLVMLAITVGVLAMQWLGSGGAASGSAAPVAPARSSGSITLSGGSA